MQFWSRLHTHCHTDPKHIKKLQAIFGILPFSSSQNCIIQSQHQIQKEKNYTEHWPKDRDLQVQLCTIYASAVNNICKKLIEQITSNMCNSI